MDKERERKIKKKRERERTRRKFRKTLVCEWVFMLEKNYLSPVYPFDNLDLVHECIYIFSVYTLM